MTKILALQTLASSDVDTPTKPLQPIPSNYSICCANSCISFNCH